jgi:membrane-associated protease RseP (regulator of RpoE activity)
MPTLVDCPESRQGEWSFHLFGIPIRVKFWFWIATLLLGAVDHPVLLLMWVAVCFGSILLHEFGHVLAFRLCGTGAEVVLYGWGGLTIPYRGVRGFGARVMIALAGPAAGFCAAALAVGLAQASGAAVHFGFRRFLPMLSVWPSATPAFYYWYVFLNDLLWVNFYWGLVNLLPIFPLDGGHVSRAIFEQRDPYRGRRRSLVLSAVVAAAVAVSAIFDRDLYRTVIFVILAVSSIQELETLRSPQPYRSAR